MSIEDRLADSLTKPWPTSCFMFLKDKLLVLPRLEFEGGGS